MVSSISFGQVNTINGKTVLTGSQSGIDTNALITDLTTAAAQPATDDQTKITANQAQITAFTSLKTALTTLQNSVDALRNPTFGSSTTNAFAARSPFLTVTDGKTVSDYVGVTTDSGAPIGKYTLTVDALATAESDQSTTFADRTSSIVNASGTNTAGQFAAGTFQINGVNVTVTQGQSLNDIASAINSTTASSNVTASIVKFSDTDYRLVLNGKNTGAANAITITDPSHVLSYTTNPDTTTTQNIFSVTQPAADSEIHFNNQDIKRSTNQISDLLDNVTFSLYGKTNGETVTLDVDKDNQSIATAIGNFVDAYNAVRTFQAQQNQRDSNGDLVKTAVLANNSTLNTVMNQIGALIAGQASIAIPSLYSSGNTVTPVRMGDLGINLDNVDAGTDASGNPTPAVTNTLTIDAGQLNTNLESFFDQVSNIFEFNFTSSNPTVGIYQRSNTVTNSNFNIVVDTSQPVGSQAKITSIDGSALTSPVALNFKTTTSMNSASFSDPSTTSFVNAPGTDNAGAFADGTFQINGANVTLTQGMTLTDIGNAINAATGTSGVTATLVQNGTNDYRLQLSGTDDGTSGITFTDPAHVLPSVSIFTTTSSNSVITGQAGTDLAGFTSFYSGNGNETITRSSGLTSKDITLSVDASQPSGQQAAVTSIFGATLATPIYLNYSTSGGSKTISGIAGTPFDGLQMIYTGNGSDTANISMSQGIADKLYNSLDGLLNGNTSVTGSVGPIDEAIQSLTDTDTKLQDSINTINDQVSTLRDQLLTKFANLEASISSANQLLQLLSAQDNAALVNSGH